MSQAQGKGGNPRPSDMHGVYNKPKFKRGRGHDNHHYRGPYNDFQCYNTKYNFRPYWSYRKRKPPLRQQQQQRKRSPSPFSGTEEYAMKKIQEASDMIKKRLMMPEAFDPVSVPKAVINRAEAPETETKSSKNDADKSLVKTTKKAITYNVEEIQQKILTHITKLSHGKKVNLICSNPSGYDVVIEQMHKQKRLELSKALRDMCSNQGVENSEVINSIIPDIGIKIEDLPLEVIQELSSTLDWHFDDVVYSENYGTVNVNGEVDENDHVTPVVQNSYSENYETVNISSEIDEDDHVTPVDQTLVQNSYLENYETVKVKSEVDENGHVIPIPVDQVLEQNDTNLEIKDEVSVITEIKQEINVTPVDHAVVQDNTNLEIKDEVPVVIEIKQEILDIESEEVKSDAQMESLDIEIDQAMVIDDPGQKDGEIVSENQSLNAGMSLGSQDFDTNIEMVEEKFQISGKQTVSVGVQTDFFVLKSTSVQTDQVSGQFHVDADNVQNLDAAVRSMLAIDVEITRLTKLRQDIFAALQEKENLSSKGAANKINRGAKRKTSQEQTKNEAFDVSLAEVRGALADPTVEDGADALVKAENANYDRALEFEPISEKILVIEVIRDTVLAASDKGRIFYINILDGSTVNTLKATNAPIISLCHWSGRHKRLHLIVGSSDTRMQEFDYETRKLIRSTRLKDHVQCMQIAWDYIFIGTTNGHLVRYSLKLCKIEFKQVISMDRVMVLKATKEGARRVLLVGMRNAPVTVRDAMSGLFLRTMHDLVTPTVYSLLLENSMVYCGTTFHDILVYSFHDGSSVQKLQATNSRGVSGLKIVDNLLFAGCYNGNIYVYNVKTNEHIGLIEGPGGVILSMEVVKNIVIVGTMSLKFASILIPEDILESRF